MSNVDRAGVSTAILAVGGGGVLLFPFLAALGYRDIAFFGIAMTAVSTSCWMVLRGWSRGVLPGFSEVMLLGFLIAQLFGGMIQAFTDGSGEFGAAVSVADLAFIGSYLLAAAGLGARVREIERPARTIGAIDAAVLLTGLMLMGGQFLLVPTLQADAVDGAVSAPSVLRVWYPICAYILLALLVWMSAATRPRSPSVLMLEIGFTLWATAESAFHLTSFSLSVPAWWILMLWLSAYVLIAAGIAHPDKGRLAEHEALRAEALPSRAGFLAIALLSIPLSMWAQTRFRDPLVWQLAMLGCSALILLIWLRFNLLYRYLRRLGTELRELSQIDPVSGAGNRRHFDDVMHEALVADPHPVALFVLRVEGVAIDAPRSSQERVLVAAARALGRAGAADDRVARIGEREFALIQHWPGAEEKLLGAGWRALNDLNELLRAELPDDSHWQMHGYIGIAVAPRDGASVTELLDCVCARLDAAVASGYRVMAAAPDDLGAMRDAAAMPSAKLMLAPGT
jgi:GGDEF domain-containing protein